MLAWFADPSGYIYWYNSKWFEYTGTETADMQGWGWQSVHHPKTLPDVLVRWKDCLATGKSFQMIFPLRGADGIYRPFLTIVNPVRDAAEKIIRWAGVNLEVGGMTIGRDAEEWQEMSRKIAM